MTDFAGAILALKAGQRASRSGWNGKNMWIAIVRPSQDIGQAFAGIDPLPYIAMLTADQKVVPWLASQTDMLAEDWVIVGP